MIEVCSGKQSGFATDVITTALARSVTTGLVQTAGTSDAEAPSGGIFVFIRPDASDVERIVAVMNRPSKVLIFGELPEEAIELCGLEAVSAPGPEWEDGARCPPAPLYATSRSTAKIVWSDHPLASQSPIRERPFLRFDYADEWNNLGYGRITANGGIWSISQQVEPGAAHVLARAETGTGSVSPFVTLHETAQSSVLWWNRPSGPVDSAEWAVIEAFLADWRPHELPCTPVISEIPWSYDGAITMRLDCDEDIASARPLFEIYKQRGLPFSMAIKTDQEDHSEHIALLTEVLKAGGAILSHSVSHAPRWGGSKEACEAEARGSIKWLEERIPGIKVRYAVSPFHQNPPYVPEGLTRAGLKGFIGGIVANDPEMLLARGGRIPADETGCVTHSQQCMMHGECVLAKGDRLAITKEAFLIALNSEMLFGYLDHPFSPRYDYGWGSETHRLDCHSEFLDFIKTETSSRKLLWMNENEALDWISAKARLVLKPSREGFTLASGSSSLLARGMTFGARYKGMRQPLQDLING
ncbi:hypothetical protein HGO37_21665 [Rhizobium sp. CG4]|uniref:hypothetical protein n=1 Tax=Rhizobium sp. CG4 TaxID=2726075 RepID=UPI0020337072|nr:hypothetical protein [Rhizobium sp. CG4]MCM2458003.1 hypothetical protein [Rhizobium sp. CG4]